VLEELEVRLGEPPQPDRVQVAQPEAIRARRFEAVFVCGLQEGEFPAGASELLDCTLAELGVPAWDILGGRQGSRSRYYEFAGDRARFLGTIQSNEESP
jgi:superfamily I DNA/RNA helicase